MFGPFDREVIVSNASGKVIGLNYYNAIEIVFSDTFELTATTEDGIEHFEADNLSEVLESLDDKYFPEGLNLLSKATFVERTTRTFSLVNPEVHDIVTIFPNFDITYK